MLEWYRQVLGKMLETSRVKLRSAQDIAQDAVFQHMPVGRFLSWSDAPSC